MGRNTIRNNLAPLRRMFRDALDDELVTANPAVNIEISEQAPVREANVPTLEELGKILAAADSEDTREAITVMAGLGLRRGECFALRWGDVDFVENLVTVRATNHRARIKERPKTKAGKRLVPLFPSARQALEARKRRLGVGLHPDRLVFTNEIGGAVDPGNWYRRCWKKALRDAGLEDRFHVHDVRHFALTALDEQGMKGKLRSEVVGHADEKITNSIYTKIRRRVVAAADLYAPLVAGESA
jgi:integrase